MARAGCIYRFFPVLMDRGLGVDPGTLVRKIPASRLGVSGSLPSRFAYVEYVNGPMIGMVCSASLVPRKPRRSAMDIAADSAGLKKVKGALGGTYYE